MKNYRNNCHFDFDREVKEHEQIRLTDDRAESLSILVFFVVICKDRNTIGDLTDLA